MGQPGRTFVSRVSHLLGGALFAAAALGFGSGTLSAQPTLDSLHQTAKAAGQTKVAVYGPPSAEVRAELVKAFSARFPDIEFEYSGMGGSKLFPKMAAERKAGLNTVDVVIAGNTSISRNLKPAGLIQPVDPWIVLPDVRDGRNWLGGKLTYGDDTKMMLAMLSTTNLPSVINTDMVRAGELTRDADFLDPKWKGKIVTTDPLRPGTAMVNFRRLYDLHGPEYITRLIKEQQLVFASDIRLTVDWVAKGRYAFAIAGDPTMVMEYISKGIPNLGIEHNMKWQDPTISSVGFGGLAMPIEPPHPAAAKLFVNWLLTREGQKALGTGLEYSSRRIDVEVPGLSPVLRLRPDGKYIESFTDEFANHPNTKKMQDLVKSLRAGG